MKKPEKFDHFIYSLVNATSRFSLAEDMAAASLSEEALVDCLHWLNLLIDIQELPDKEEDQCERN